MDEQKDQRSIEVAQTYFELFKHLTTLNLTAVAGVAAFYSLTALEFYALRTVLAVFVLSSVVSLAGLERSLDVLRQGSDDLRNLDELSNWATTIFATGIMSFALDASGLPELLQTLLVLAVAAYLYLRRRWFRKREGGTDGAEGAQEGAERVSWSRRVFGG